MTPDILPTPLPNQSLAEYNELVKATVLAASDKAKEHLSRGDKPAANQILKDCIRTLRAVIVLLPQSGSIHPGSTSDAETSAALGRIAVGPIFVGMAGQSRASSKLAKHRSWDRKFSSFNRTTSATRSTSAPPDRVALYRDRIKVEHYAWGMITRLQKVRTKLAPS